MVVGLLHELLTQDFLSQQVPPVLQCGVSHIVDRLEERRSLSLQSHLLLSSGLDDLLAMDQSHECVGVDEVDDGEDVLGLPAGDPSLVGEEPTALVLDIINVLCEEGYTEAKGEYASALVALVVKLNPILFSTNCI